ncbi:MAG TPA: PEP-CTERM sorting domain-containing protein [Bryobacteraceae bacterium]|jgi:hypothetical protein
MKPYIALLKHAIVAAICLGALVLTMPSHAATITWTDWSSVTAGNPGSGTGSIAPSITVTYSGQTTGRSVNYPSWTPTGSFSGGTVDNAPPRSFNSVALTGGNTNTNTLTFSTAVVDPVFAIWSLGAPSVPATFNFTSAEPFTLQGGGPSVEYGGSSITVSGNTVSGREGNGVIQFSGTFTQLTWTNPSAESFYVFTVGIAGTAPPPTGVPEPASLLICGAGLAGLVFLRKFRRTV